MLQVTQLLYLLTTPTILPNEQFCSLLVFSPLLLLLSLGASKNNNIKIEHCISRKFQKTSICLVPDCVSSIQACSPVKAQLFLLFSYGVWILYDENHKCMCHG